MCVFQLDRDGGPIDFRLDDNMASLRDVRLTYIDAARDYQIATVSARNEGAETVRVAELQAPIIMDQTQARNIVERQLARSEPSRRKASLSLPLQDAPAAGDIVTLPDAEGLWQVENLNLGFQADVSLAALPNTQSTPIVSGAQPQVLSDPIWVSEAVALAFDFTGLEGVQVGALLNPFRAAEFSFGGASVSTAAPVKIGALLTPLSYQPPVLWDRLSEIEIYMPDGIWFAVSEAETLAGANRFAIETEAGWEIIGAAEVSLVGAQTYRLKTLLRGLRNSDDAMIPIIPAGARVVALDAGVANLPIDEDFIGQELDIAVNAGGREGVAGQIDYRGAHLRPLSVVHLKSEAIGEEMELSWIPRNFDNAESVDPDAEVEISWAAERITVNGATARIPLASGSGTVVTLTPIDPIGGAGAPKTILV